MAKGDRVKSVTSNINQLYITLSIAWFVCTKNNGRRESAEIGETFVLYRLIVEH